MLLDVKQNNKHWPLLPILDKLMRYAIADGLWIDLHLYKYDHLRTIFHHRGCLRNSQPSVRYRPSTSPLKNASEINNSNTIFWTSIGMESSNTCFSLEAWTHKTFTSHHLVHWLRHLEKLWLPGWDYHLIIKWNEQTRASVFSIPSHNNTVDNISWEEFSTVSASWRIAE